MQMRNLSTCNYIMYVPPVGMRDTYIHVDTNVLQQTTLIAVERVKSIRTSK